MLWLVSMFLGTQECFLVIAQIPPQPSRTSSIHQWPLVTSVDGVGNDGSLEPSEQLLCPNHLPQSRHTTGAFGQPAAAQLCMVDDCCRENGATEKRCDESAHAPLKKDHVGA